MSRLARRAVPIAAACLLAACGGGDPASPTLVPSVVGTYTLRGINGGALPYVTTSRVGSDSIVYRGATLQLFAEHSFTEQLQTHLVAGGKATDANDTFTGQYSVSGSTVTLTYLTGGIAPGGVIVATVSSDSLTAQDGAMVLQYRR